MQRILVGLLCASVTALSAPAQRPSVLILSADGPTEPAGPNLARLVRAGIRFEVATLQIAPLLTGRCPQRGAVEFHPQGGPTLHLGEVTLAEVLRDAGYRTAFAGEWRLGAAPDHGPERQGFDESFPANTDAALRFISTDDRAGDGAPFYLHVALDNGRVDDWLGRLAPTDDTLVVLLSSVGPRGSVLVSCPKRLPAGETRSQAIRSEDVFPTILELCDSSPPEVEIDGTSLVAILRDATAPEPPTPRRGEDPEAWAHRVFPAVGLRRLRAALEASGRASDELAVFTQLVPSAGRAYVRGETLYFELEEDAQRISFPRLHNPISRARLLSGEELKLGQDNRRWWIDVPAALRAEVDGRIVVALDVLGAPTVAHGPRPLGPDEDGKFVLPAHEAEVFGEKLCYEPQPHKNTLGYWVRPEDWARWTIEVTEPGTFEVDLLQGCGAGHGGSEVDVHVADQVLSFVVVDTGHFQNFERRALGAVTLAPGTHHVELRPRTKAKGAVCDVREVRLEPAN